MGRIDWEYETNKQKATVGGGGTTAFPGRVSARVTS